MIRQNCNQYLCILLGLDFSTGLLAIIAAMFPQLAFASGLGSILFASPAVMALMLELLFDPRTEDGGLVVRAGVSVLIFGFKVLLLTSFGFGAAALTFNDFDGGSGGGGGFIGVLCLGGRGGGKSDEV